MDFERTMDVLLVVSEALTNAAEHGHRFDETPIELHATWSSDELMVMVSDTGEWGMPHAMADRGRGVGIIRALADEASIDNTHRGTTVRVSFSLGQVQGSAAAAVPSDELALPRASDAQRPSAGQPASWNPVSMDPTGVDDQAGLLLDRRELVGSSV